MKKKHIITFGGYVGAGKSTAGKEVARRLGFEHYSSGDFMREMAKEKGLDFVEFNKMIETTSDESRRINDMIDERAKNLGVEKDNLVFDAHIGFSFIPQSFKVYLTLDPEVAAKRVGSQDRDDESFESEQDVVEKVIWRANSLQDRFKKLYNVDIRDLSNYDLVVDTGLAENNVESVVQQVIDGYQQWLEE